MRFSNRKNEECVVTPLAFLEMKIKDNIITSCDQSWMFVDGANKTINRVSNPPVTQGILVREAPVNSGRGPLRPNRIPVLGLRKGLPGERSISANGPADLFLAPVLRSMNFDYDQEQERSAGFLLSTLNSQHLRECRRRGSNPHTIASTGF